MGRPRKKNRVLGPYQHGERWRVDALGPSVAAEYGTDRKHFYFSSEKEARKFLVRLEDMIGQDETISAEEAIESFVASVKARDPERTTWEDARAKVRPLLKYLPKGAQADEITQRAIEKRLATQEKTASRRSTLKQIRLFFRWAVEKGYVAADPSARIKIEGTSSRGKEQLRIAEARKLAEVLYEDPSPNATAALLPLVCGFRPREVRRLQVRDVDVRDDGTVSLEIVNAKTQAGNRAIEVGDERLSQRLAALVKQRGLTEYLFPAPRAKTGYHGQHWLPDLVKRYCRQAGVTEVCAHGLRGTHATICATMGTTTKIVSEALGHANQRVTLDHYIQDGATAQAGVNKVVSLFGPKRAGSETAQGQG